MSLCFHKDNLSNRFWAGSYLKERKEEWEWEERKEAKCYFIFKVTGQNPVGDLCLCKGNCIGLENKNAH